MNECALMVVWIIFCDSLLDCSFWVVEERSLYSAFSVLYRHFPFRKKIGEKLNEVVNGIPKGGLKGEYTEGIKVFTPRDPCI